MSVGAGTKDSEVAKFCVEKNISGLEFLSGIPGTIGGNIKMNAGCYGNQISDNLIDCTIIDEKLNKKIVKKNEIDFHYRKSSFDNGQIIIEARFKIQKCNKLQIKKKSQLYQIRERNLNLCHLEQEEAHSQILLLILRGNSLMK